MESSLGIHYKKERTKRPKTLRVKEKREHLATGGNHREEAGEEKLMVEGEGIGGKRHRKEEHDEKTNLHSENMLH